MFWQTLTHPKKEDRIHDGRKRIDITFSNYAKEKVFYKLQTLERYPCSYIFIECKNYAPDVNNPELDQLAGRFSPRRGKVGILSYRKTRNKDLLIDKCKDTYSDDRGLIIPLSDADLIEALESIYDNEKREIYTIIEELIDQIRK